MANISVVPASKDFGSLLVGTTSASQSFVLSNTTLPAASVTISDINFAAPFLAKYSTEGVAAYRATISTFSFQAFNPNVNTAIRAMARQTDGKIIIGGDFSTVGGVGRSKVARLEENGSLDTSFASIVVNNLSVYAVGVQSDGKVIIGGDFTSVGGVVRNYLARIEADGTLDATFDPNLNGLVFSITVQPDDKFIVCGAFTTVGATGRNYIARFNADGSLDAGFDPSANAWILGSAVQPDGKILVGGYFNWIAASGRTRVARLEADGTIDNTFVDPVSDVWVDTFFVLPDSKILIGGYFTTIGGVARNRVARLNADGTLDLTFGDANVQVNWVNAVVAQTDGKVIIGGTFVSALGTPRNRIARLNSDGTLDVTFDPNSDGDVHVLLALPDDRLLVAGTFNNIASGARKCIARLSSTGALDLSTPDVTLDVIATPMAVGIFTDTVVVTSTSGGTVETNDISLACIGAILVIGDKIYYPSDFPAAPIVGDIYDTILDVTDNDPTKTNTGLSFTHGSRITWTGVTWTEELAWLTLTPETLLYNNVAPGIRSYTQSFVASNAYGSLKRCTLQVSPGPDGLEYSAMLQSGFLFTNSYPAGLVIEDGDSSIFSVLARPMHIGTQSDWWVLEYDVTVTMYLLDETSDYILDESGNRILTE